MNSKQAKCERKYNRQVVYRYPHAHRRHMGATRRKSTTRRLALATKPLHWMWVTAIKATPQRERLCASRKLKFLYTQW